MSKGEGVPQKLGVRKIKPLARHHLSLTGLNVIGFYKAGLLLFMVSGPNLRLFLNDLTVTKQLRIT